MITINERRRKEPTYFISWMPFYQNWQLLYASKMMNFSSSLSKVTNVREKIKIISYFLKLPMKFSSVVSLCLVYFLNFFLFGEQSVNSISCTRQSKIVRRFCLNWNMFHVSSYVFHLWDSVTSEFEILQLYSFRGLWIFAWYTSPFFFTSRKISVNSLKFTYQEIDQIDFLLKTIQFI